MTIFICIFINGVSKWIGPMFQDLGFLSSHEWCNGINFQHLDVHEHNFFLLQDHERECIITMHISRKSLGNQNLRSTFQYHGHIHVLYISQLDLLLHLSCLHYFLLNFHPLIHCHLIHRLHFHLLHFRHLHSHHRQFHLLQ